MEILDTQIVSYALKRKTDFAVKGKIISAITANELLRVHSSKLYSANYYVPVPSSTHFSAMTGYGYSLNRDHPFPKSVTDQVILEFGNQYPTLVEYGSLAVSMVINKQLSPLFIEAIKFLEKEERKTVRKRFDFLLENEITCIPLTREFVGISMLLLQQFTKQHNLKKDFRNSVNDMLILGTAIGSSACLVTEDSLLNRFTSTIYSAYLKKDHKSLTIDFKKGLSTSSESTPESKSYINKGWQIKFRNYRNFHSDKTWR